MTSVPTLNPHCSTSLQPCGRIHPHMICRGPYPSPPLTRVRVRSPRHPASPVVGCPVDLDDRVGLAGNHRSISCHHHCWILRFQFLWGYLSVAFPVRLCGIAHVDGACGSVVGSASRLAMTSASRAVAIAMHGGAIVQPKLIGAGLVGQAAGKDNEPRSGRMVRWGR
jgi:hypothetical protein